MLIDTGRVSAVGTDKVPQTTSEERFLITGWKRLSLKGRSEILQAFNVLLTAEYMAYKKAIHRPRTKIILDTKKHLMLR